MRLNEIKDKDGARKFRVRIGRGIGSGVGKTGGRGGKGQTARSGVAIGGFEGGQMPLYRRLPKRGFNPLNRGRYNEVTLRRLQSAVEAGQIADGADVDADVLVKAGVIRRKLDGVRVIGGGDLKAKLKLTVDHITAGARSSVEGAGGSVSLIERKVLAADVAKREKTAAKKAKRGKSTKTASED